MICKINDLIWLVWINICQFDAILLWVKGQLRKSGCAARCPRLSVPLWRDDAMRSSDTICSDTTTAEKSPAAEYHSHGTPSIVWKIAFQNKSIASCDILLCRSKDWRNTGSICGGCGVWTRVFIVLVLVSCSENSETFLTSNSCQRQIRPEPRLQQRWNMGNVGEFLLAAWCLTRRVFSRRSQILQWLSQCSGPPARLPTSLVGIGVGEPVGACTFLQMQAVEPLI